MTIQQFDALETICGRMEQLRSLIVLYTDAFATSTNVDHLKDAIETRPREYILLACLIFDLAHDTWKDMRRTLDQIELPPHQ